jgi:hypothetical protein
MPQNASNNSGKRKAAETLESAGKRAKTDDDTEPDPEPKLDVTVQTGLYAAEMFASNIAVKHIVNLVVVGVLFGLFTSVTRLSSSS